MRENCSYGSVRERGGNEPLYSEKLALVVYSSGLRQVSYPVLYFYLLVRLIDTVQGVMTPWMPTDWRPLFIKGLWYGVAFSCPCQGLIGVSSG